MHPSSLTVDLDAYFQRIGYAGPRVATLAVLKELALHHTQTIPFENLDVLLGRPVPIDFESVEKKLVHSRRGGYCFEHNFLFFEVLKALGFAVTALAGRVVWMLPDGAPRPPLTHRLTLVKLSEGRFLADVGFGGQSPTAPIQLEPGLAQTTPHGIFRVSDTAEGYTLDSKLPDRWAPMYRFTLEPQGENDFELGNWFTSAHPRSHFRQRLGVARVIGEARHNLRNQMLTLYHNDGRIEERPIPSAAALETVLTETFGIDLPARVEDLLARITAD